MSKDDYARIMVHAPTRVALALVFAFGGGAGWHLVYYDDGAVDEVERELASCLVAYADARSLADQQAHDIAQLSDWATNTLRTLGHFQRLEALNSAPAAYAKGSLEVSP